jgi:hypothetical protein
MLCLTACWILNTENSEIFHRALREGRSVYFVYASVHSVFKIRQHNFYRPGIKDF